MGFSMDTKGKTYDVLEIPTAEWITDSGDLVQTLEEHTSSTFTRSVDFLYNMGALVSIYSHSSSENGLPLKYIQYTLSKPNMWAATPAILRDWWLTRTQVTIDPQYQLTPDGMSTLTFTVSGSNSPDTSIDISLASITNLKIYLDGVVSTNYRSSNNGIKVQIGKASNVTLTYGGSSSGGTFMQTSQSDFEAGLLNSLDSSSIPGQLTLARQSLPPTSLFSDDFSNATWTNAHWTTRAGAWSVANGTYNVVGASNQYSIAYAGSTSWSNYTVEAMVRGVSGSAGAQIGARLNPSSGARYSLWLYPSSAGGPNIARLAKFTSWTNWSPIGQASVSTDSSWHILRIELSGNNIKCYYDGNLVITAIDSSLASGLISFETWDSTCAYDWVNVTSANSGVGYVSSGALVSSAFDAKNTVTWGTISWTASSPTGTAIQFRTRSAPTQEALSTAVWSDVYGASGSAITSVGNRWIQYQAVFSTNNQAVTPTLYDIKITFT
jgi:hypothetical protein